MEQATVEMPGAPSRRADPVAVGRLHVLTDFRFQQRLAPAALARLAIEGGADTIQFRQKEGSTRERWWNLKATYEACRGGGVPLIVDDDFGMALAVSAAGVHVGEHDLPVAAVRAAAPAGFLVGATAATLELALAAQRDGADYIGFGPVFATRSKGSPAPVRGLGALAEVCRALRIPVVAIAGITPARVSQVLDAGAHGVAVMTAVSTSADPRAATAELREAIEAYR
jgi:thiamine-phosphate pyrophosphorylase